MICHSFSAYVVLRFITNYPELSWKRIGQAVLLSPVGLTPLEEDYKSSPNGCGDCLYACFIKVGWALKLNYKTMLRNMFCCLKKTLINDFVSEFDL